MKNKVWFTNVLRVINGRFRTTFFLVKHFFLKNADVAISQNKHVFYCHVLKTATYFSEIIGAIGKKNSAIVTIKNNDSVLKYAKQEGIEHLAWARKNNLSESLNVSLNHPLYSTLRKLALQYEGIKEMLFQHKPEKIMFSEGTSSAAELISLAAKNFNIKTIRIQYGKATSLHSGYRNMSFDEMLMWGEGFSERLRGISPAPQYFNVGHFLLDKKISVSSNLKNSLEINENCKVITIFTQPVCEDLTGDEYDILVKYTLMILDSIRNIKIVVRKHPADNSRKFEKIATEFSNRMKIIRSGELTLLENILISDFVVSFNSTTIAEAIACNVLPIIISIDSVGLTFPYPERFGAAVLSSSAEDAKNISLNLLDDNELIASYSKSMKKFTKKYFHKMDGKSLERVCNHILYDIA